MSDLKTNLQEILQDKNTNLKPENLKQGITCLGVEGTMQSGIDTSDANATETDIIQDKTAYVNGQKITGILPEIKASESVNVCNNYELFLKDNTVSNQTIFTVQDRDGTSHTFIVPDSIAQFPYYTIFYHKTLTSYRLDTFAIIVSDKEFFMSNNASYIGKNDGLLYNWDSDGMSYHASFESQIEELSNLTKETIHLAGNSVAGSPYMASDAIYSSFAVKDSNGSIVIQKSESDDGSLYSKELLVRGTETNDKIFRTNAIQNAHINVDDIIDVIGLTADKIKAGETILGITGTYTGENDTSL